MKQWNHRDREAEQQLIADAIPVVLARHEEGGDKPPTIKDLADETGLRRDYLYEYPELLKQFRESRSAAAGKSVAVMELEAECDALKQSLVALRAELGQRDEEVRHLRLLLAETTYALEESRNPEPPVGGPPRLQSV